MAKVRTKLGLKPAGFAAKLDTSQRAVENWERGENRPHPDHLRRMAELVPSLRDEIEQELAVYAWHPRRDKEPRPAVALDAELQLRVVQLAKERGIDFAEMLRKVVSAGLKVLTPSSSTRRQPPAQRKRA